MEQLEVEEVWELLAMEVLVLVSQLEVVVLALMVQFLVQSDDLELCLGRLLQERKLSVCQ